MQRGSPSEERYVSSEERDRIFYALECAARLYEDELWRNPRNAPVREYLLNTRKLSESTLRQFRVGFAPDDWHFIERNLEEGQGIQRQTLLDAGLIGAKDLDRQKTDSLEDAAHVYSQFCKRILFPYLERDRVFGFTARYWGDTVADEQAKYVNSPSRIVFNKSKLLYNGGAALEAAHRDSQKLAIVEGAIDVMHAAQQGLHYFASPAGTAFTEEQAALVRTRLPNQDVILWFDSDAGGLDSAERTIEKLLGYKLKVIFSDEGKDPADLAQEGKRLDSYLDVGVSDGFGFLVWRKAEKLMGKGKGEQIVRASLEDKLRVITALEPALSHVSEHERGLYYIDLADKTGLHRDALVRKFDFSGNGPSNQSVRGKAERRTHQREEHMAPGATIDMQRARYQCVRRFLQQILAAAEPEHYVGYFALKIKEIPGVLFIDEARAIFELLARRNDFSDMHEASTHLYRDSWRSAFLGDVIAYGQRQEKVLCLPTVYELLTAPLQNAAPRYFRQEQEKSNGQSTQHQRQNSFAEQRAEIVRKVQPEEIEETFTNLLAYHAASIVQERKQGGASFASLIQQIKSFDTSV